MTILVAEDDEDDFYFLQCIFKKTDVVSLHRVGDGEEALDYLQGRGRFSDRQAYPFPNILLLDLRLPGLSGHELLIKLNGHPQFGHLRKCILSGSDLRRDREQAARNGADDYFVKPLRLGHLAALFGEQTKPLGRVAESALGREA